MTEECACAKGYICTQTLCLSVCPSIYPSVCLSIHPTICLSVLSIHLSVCLSVCLLLHRSKLEQDKLGAHHTKVVERLESEVSALQAELDNSRLVESALQEKVERQEALLSQWREQENSNSAFSGLESEVGTLQTTVAALEREKETLTLKVGKREAGVLSWLLQQH